MLTTGSDTYVLPVEADEYISTHYWEFNILRAHWSVLTDEEKEIYLRQSLEEIEGLFFVGRKIDVNQPLSFPRIRRNYMGGHSCYIHNPYPAGRLEDIPKEVKNAQTENALGIIAKEYSSVSDRQFMTMQSLGAMKNIKYNKRESGELGFGEELKTGGQAVYGLSSPKAQTLLRPWLGAFKI